MGLFDFPRINFRGTITLNPGTANNDDYAQQPGALTLPASWGPFAGQPFGLVDSKLVQARTYGMSDEAFIAWVQQQQTFDVSGSPGQTSKQFPAEWNYYGDMSSSAKTSVIGVQTAPGKLYTASDPSVPLSAVVGAPLTFTGGITDVNSEGSPPATQFFIDALQLVSGGKAVVKGQPSKGACQWINFYRNVNRQGDAGAGGYIYHVLLNGGGTTINVPGISPKVRGLVIRYYLFNIQQGAGGQALADLYEQKKANPATLQIIGTLAPLTDDERILTGPVGRLMIMNAANIKTPDSSKNNSGPSGVISLAPAVLRQNGSTISADFSGTFPDNGQGSPTPKFDFGPVSLMVAGGGKTATIGAVPYTDVNGGDQRGWLFDFDIASNADAQKALQDPEATFSLSNPTFQTVLAEADYYFPSNQQAIYAEQHGAGGLFRNQGTLEPATVSVYRRGKLLSAADCPPITVWQYRSTPIQSPGNATVLRANFAPGQPITIDTSQPGNALLTFTINDAANPAPGGYPPQNYATFSFPPYITNMPSISVRILPNDEDFSRYYIDPADDEPVGNELLTFAVLYTKVLRTYYLLYPSMNKVIPLNSESALAARAQAILDRTELSLWMTTAYMPRTRDMSRSRRTLLRAWCRKVLMG
ncbi:MAG TPA: hypothetical protein VJ276_21850 [Thermoanaerobaculia bacterium]|nr:hypothetical protein [Thermoanaerobaculia bacterium]